jgi:predicted esterase
MNRLFAQNLTWIFIFLCLAILLAADARAQDHSESGELVIELTLTRLLGDQQAKLYQEIVPGDETITWQVYIPDNNSGRLPGLFVYVSPHNSGGIDPRWKAVMDQQNLIYIAADRSGNRKPVNRRMVMATQAVKVVAQRWPFDVKRIMVSGFSGGGRVASILATQYPEVFTAALYICGVDFWKKSRAPKVDRLTQNRFVFLTGSKDFNRDETRRIYRKYLKAGAGHSKLMVIPNSSHELPDARNLSEALDFLSGKTGQAIALPDISDQ